MSQVFLYNSSNMKLFIYVLLFSLLACSSFVPNPKVKPVFTLNDFGKTVEINGKKIALLGIERPVRLTVIPEKGVLMCINAGFASKKKWLHIYSIYSIQLIRSVINNGPGDGEMLGAFQLQYDNRNGGEIYITDILKQQIIIYKADSLIEGNEKPFKIIGKPFHGYQGISLNENSLMRSVITDNSHNIVDIRLSALNHSRMLFNKYRSDLSVRDSFGVYPQTTEEIPTQMLSQVLDGCLSLSTDNKHLVFTGLTTDYLSVYDTSGKMIASAIGPGELDANYKIQKIGGGERVIPSSGRYGYGGKAKIDKGVIYVLYNGKDMKTHGEHVTDLFQFTYKLKPTIRYKLNIPIYDFEIDWRTKRLYGLRMEGSTSQLVIFQL